MKNRTEVVSARFSPDERKILERLAQCDERKNSDMLRLLVLHEARARGLALDATEAKPASKSGGVSDATGG